MGHWYEGLEMRKVNPVGEFMKLSHSWGIMMSPKEPVH